MMLGRADRNARRIAQQVVLGDVGFASLVIVLLATGGGLLLDFLLTGLHPIFSVGLLIVSVPLALYWALRRTLSLSMDHKPSQSDYARNLALATVAGQAGCSTVVLIFLALFAGMFLDSRLDTHPIFTIGLVLASIPVSLYAMVRLLLSSVGALNLTPVTRASDARSPDPNEDSLTKEGGS